MSVKIPPTKRYQCQIIGTCKCCLIWKKGPVFENLVKDLEMRASSVI